MSVYIHDIATAVPDTFGEQQKLREFMKAGLAHSRKTQAIIHRIYSQSGIEKRHLFSDDFKEDREDSFFKRSLSNDNAPGTGERNEIYKTESTKLYLKVAQKLLDQNPEFDKKDITHIITVSCTGFFAPGPDFEIVRGLGLNPSTKRFYLGFMGCYASLPALKMAESFCKADPNAVVLIVSTELCTLHFQNKNDIDNLIASSVFADGAAGVIVSAKEPIRKGYRLDLFSSSLAYEGESDMAWTIGDAGFNMILSSYVPEIIAANLGKVLAPTFDELSISKDDIDIWAVHPGGRAIVDKVEQGLELKKEQVTSSRTVLAQYGNMSSATILFVLDEIRNSNIPTNSKVLPIAFGPGLTIETGLLTYINNQDN
ncbi:MAG: type III polyketide synthase [Balneolaceae bacterium]